MWLFDLLKGKKESKPNGKGAIPEETKAEPKAVSDELEKANNLGDIAKIMLDNDVIGSPVDDNHNTLDEDLQHLSQDGELPLGWVYYFRDFISQQEKQIDAKWNKVYAAPSVKDKIDAYKRYFSTIESVGNTCKKAGECHYKWFCENILESTWYNQQINEYRRFEVESPELIKRDELLATLEPDIMNKLKGCEGVLQSDFIKLFDPLIKKDVSDFLYNADKYGKIKRTKSGRSYILELKK